MTLTPIYDSVVTENRAKHLIGLAGATVEVVDRDSGLPVTVYADEDGTTPVTNPLTVDDAGRFSCWVDVGDYNLVVTSPDGDVETVPVNVGGAGHDSNAVHQTGDETVAGKKTFTPTSVSPAIALNPLTDGYFQDFAGVGSGVVPDDKDPGTPHWFDDVTIGANATCVYATDSLLSPLPAALKISSTSSSSAAVSCQWGGAAYRDLTTHYGRFYFYMDTNIANNTIPLSWTATGKLRIRSSDRKFEILNAGSTAQTLDNADTKSTNALTAATWYRFEWEVVHGTSGTITIKLFSGHSTTPVETRVATFSNGTVAGAMEHGLPTTANLSGGFIRLAALAGGCLAYPGPYAGTAANVQVVTPDGMSLMEQLPGGNLIIRASDNYNIASGGEPKYTVQRGDPIFRTHSRGLMMGGNFNVGNPMTKSDLDQTDIFFDLENRRIAARSYNLRIINDPPDVNFQRMNTSASNMADPNQPWNALNSGYYVLGRSAVWTAGSHIVTIADSSEPALTMRDHGHGVTLGGDLYGAGGEDLHIAEVTGPRSFTVTTAATTSSAATTATGVNTLNSATINCGSTTGFDDPQATTTATGVNALNSATINCASTTGFAANGYAYLGGVAFWYTSKTGTTFAGCGPHAATTGGEAITYELMTAYLAGTAFTYTGITASSFTGCGTHAATTGGEAITQGNWKIRGFPYPLQTSGVATGGTVGQLKFGPYAFQSKGKATSGMHTQSGTQSVAVALTGGGYTWTSADVGRHLLINDDPTLDGNDNGSFIVQGVNSTTVNGAQLANADPFNVVSTAGFPAAGKVMVGSTAVRYTGRTATSFTGTTGVPVTSGGEAVQALWLDQNVGATLSDVGYRVAGGDNDPAAEPIQTFCNISADLNVHNCNFGNSGPACSVSSGNLSFNMIRDGILFINTTSGGYTATPLETMFKVRSTGTFGHGTGATVTQLTDKSTGVTINRGAGKITMHNAALAAGTAVTFTVTNSTVNIDDVVIVNIRSGPVTDNSYQTQVSAVAAGSFKIQLRNITAGSLSEAVVLNFATILGAVT